MKVMDRVGVPMTGLFEVDIVRNVSIPIEHGRFQLSADLYRPRTDQPVPALVTVTPYRKDAGAGIDAHAMHLWFAARGYACLLVDLRGTGGSGGTLRPPFDPDEADDAVAAIDWAASQSWCSGEVGMWGTSYCATVTMRSAGRKPLALHAIVPMLGMTDPERDFVHPDGAHGCGASFLEWGTATAMNQVMPELVGPGASGRDVVTSNLSDEEPWIIHMFRRTPGDPTWRRSAFDASAIETPALVVAGWHDLFGAASIRAYEAMSGPKKLIVGPWAHEPPWIATKEPIDIWSIVLDWWDHWLRGIDNGVMNREAVTLYQLGEGAGWRTLTSWPRPGLGQLLEADEAHGLTAPTLFRRDAGASGFSAGHSLSDPTIGSQSGLWWSGGMGGAFSSPLDQHDDDLRSLSYTTAPLAGMVLVGRPRVVVDWAKDVPTRLVVRLTDVDPDGRSSLIAHGLTTDESPMGTEIDLSPTCYQLAAGHRVRLAISTADFPRLSPAIDVQPDQAPPATLMVSLPVLEPGLLEPAEPQRPMGGAFDVGLLKSWVPEWSVRRDCASDSVEHQWGSTLEVFTADLGHRLVMSASHLASTSRRDPHASIASAMRRTEIHAADAEMVVVSVATSMTSAGLTVTTTVDVGAATAFQRTWKCDAERRDGAPRRSRE